MTRILSGGGKDSAGNPTTKTIGRPGQGSVARGTRQSARVLAKTDPADGVLNTPISDIPLLSLGAKATKTTALTGDNNDLKFTAAQPGTEANSIRIRYVDPSAFDQELGVAVSGNDITVNLATGPDPGAITSTAAEIKAAINMDAAASQLVTAEIAAGNTGAGVVTAMSYITLENGTEGEMRAPLPPELVPGPSAPTISGKEEQTITNPDIALTAPVRRPAGTGVNRRIRKR